MQKKKAVVFYIDFDDTLYDHTYHWKYNEDLEYNMLFGFNKIPYEEKYLNHELVNKVQTIKNENIKNGIETIICLLTGCRTSVYFKSKTDFLDKVTPDMFDEYFSVATQEDKLPMINAYNEHLKSNYEISKVIVIDDSFIVTALSQDKGYDAMAPGYFEKHYKLEL